VFLQKYDLDLHSVRFIRLDTTLEQTAPRLNFLLLESEYLPQESSLYPEPYRATQFLAYLCRRLDILAVEYPSVRGGFKDNPDAVNLVLLDSAVCLAATMSAGEPFEYDDAS
jgi:hypothetical protein